MSKRFHNRAVACSCGAELTDLHRDICPVYEELISGDLTYESPPVVIAKQQQSEAAKAIKAIHRVENINRSASYKRTQGHKVTPINSVAAALNAALSVVHR